VPERTRPSAILHSKVAILSSEQALRTRLTARISSDVSITTMGVEELMRTFRRLSPSVIRICELSAVSFEQGQVIVRSLLVPLAHWRFVSHSAQVVAAKRLTIHNLHPYNKEFGPTRISL